MNPQLLQDVSRLLDAIAHPPGDRFNTDSLAQWAMQTQAEAERLAPIVRDQVPRSPPLELRLSALREQGWVVAVHNDYRQAGVLRTFWLFTRGDFCARGEGDTDAIALAAVEREIVRIETVVDAARGGQR